MDEKTKKMIDPDEIDEMEEEQVPESEAEELEETAFTEESEVVDLPMIPLRGLSVFPNMVLHFDIGREKSINALEKAMIMDQHIFLASQKDDETDLPTPDDFYHIGTIGKIKQMLKLPGDSIRVLVEGICRGRIEDVLFEVPYFRCRVRKIEDEPIKEDDAEAEALMRTVLTSFDDYISINQSLAPEVFATVVSINEPGRMADMVASHLECKLEDKQTLLEILDPKERLEKLNTILLKEIEILNIEQDINSKVKSQINQNQREYYLREQMRAIQDELGVTEDVEDEIEGFRRKLEELQLEDKTREKIEKEISRFSKMQPSSAEATVSRSYIETVLELPWNTESEDNLDLNKAEEILNEDHYGLEKVKERVLEYLPRAYKDGNDVEARDHMANASCMAGLAFANAFLGVNHSLAHKLGAFHHLPHGIANAVVLLDVMRYNSAEVPTKMGTFPQYQYPKTLARYAEIGRSVGLTGKNDAEVFEKLLAKLDDLMRTIEIMPTIRDYGVDEKYFLETLDEMSEQAFNDQCTGANPRYPLVSELKDIYLKAYYGEMPKKEEKKAK